MPRAPKKIFYKIGEACQLVDIQPYVLRYWETEFPSLSPGKSRSGQRVYSEKELEVIRRIKELLYEEGYTIAGAKKKLETELAENGEPGPAEPLAAAAAAPEAPAAKAPAAKGGAAKGAAAKGGAKGRAETATEPEGGEGTDASPKAAAVAPDEDVERLRSGVERALAQARDLLAYLDSLG